jgi:cob(I)alamin adenosyltransferase
MSPAHKRAARARRRGYVHVYTGDGKGKTTAALGLAVRAVGAGLRVFLAQFMKGEGGSEAAALARFAEQVTLKTFGRPSFVRRRPARKDIEAARAGLACVRRILRSGAYDVVILDEANVAAHFGLLDVDDLLALADGRPPGVELVFTGRRADPRLVEKADLVTEMRPVKHYYDRGVPARIGIET